MGRTGILRGWPERQKGRRPLKLVFVSTENVNLMGACCCSLLTGLESRCRVLVRTEAWLQLSVEPAHYRETRRQQVLVLVLVLVPVAHTGELAEFANGKRKRALARHRHRHKKAQGTGTSTHNR